MEMPIHEINFYVILRRLSTEQRNFDENPWSFDTDNHEHGYVHSFVGKKNKVQIQIQTHKNTLLTMIVVVAFE